MQYFAILLFALSGMLLLYAALLAKTKDIRLIGRSYAAKPKDKRAYATQFAKVIAVVAVAPALAGIVGLLTDAALPTLLTLLIGMIACMRLGVGIMGDSDEEDSFSKK